jgi:MFS family permease
VNRRLAILLAMAMFVLVVDTSLMNVSISYVVHDLHTTVSGVQSAIALEALVSAAFILIGSKTADLIGRKRGYVIGLLATPPERSPWRWRRASWRSSSSGQSSAGSAPRSCCRRCRR